MKYIVFKVCFGKVNITLKLKDKNGKIGIKIKGAITWQLKIQEMIDK